MQLRGVVFVQKIAVGVDILRDHEMILRSSHLGATAKLWQDTRNYKKLVRLLHYISVRRRNTTSSPKQVSNKAVSPNSHPCASHSRSHAGNHNEVDVLIKFSFPRLITNALPLRRFKLHKRASVLSWYWWHSVKKALRSGNGRHAKTLKAICVHRLIE